MKTDPAFEEFYEREFKTVFRAAYLVCGNRAVAEDATQDAFVRALERWGRLRGGEWVTGWLITTAMNLLRRRRRLEAPWRLVTAGPRDETSSLDTGLDVRAALRRLPDRQLEAVILHYLVDLPIEEVASLMGCADGTVKAHLAKARQALAQAIEKNERR